MQFSTKLLVFGCILAFLNISDSAKVDGGGKGGSAKGGELPPIDDAMFERYKSQVCNVVPTFMGKTGKNYTFLDEITEEEVYEMAFINMAYGLVNDAISPLTEDNAPKKRIMDMISLITKQTCENSVVSEMYINAAKNLFMYYMYKRSKSPSTFMVPQPASGGNNTDPQSMEMTWSEVLNMLEQCSESVEPLPIEQMCDAASYLVSEGETIPIGIVEEQIDVELNAGGHEFMDEVIEAVWFMFSITYARCYTVYYPREDWVVQFFDNFKQEFLAPFVNRWRRPGPMAEFFPLIFGPFDFRRNRANLRACNSAAYQYEGIQERQLVRPLTVTVEAVTMYNFKTGISLTKK